MPPNLFIVGEAKSGTTALAHFLSQHPAVHISDPKEPNYFNTDHREESDAYHGYARYFAYRTEADYLALFKEAPIAGEGSVPYMFSRVAARNIHAFNPDAKIIMMFREPVEFLYSLHGEYLIHDQEEETDFLRALSLEPERRQGKHLPPRVRFPSYLYYSERVRFSEHAKRYLTHFPREQIKIIFHDDFKSDNERVFRDVCRFLGVDDTFTPTWGLVNPHQRTRYRVFKRFMESPLIFKPLRALLPARLFKRLKSRFYQLVRKTQQRTPLDSRTRQTLQRRYRPEVEALGELLGIDLLKKWGYDG